MLLTTTVERGGSGAETMRGALLHGQRSRVGHTAWLGGPHGMAGWWQEKDREKEKAEADLLQPTVRAVPALWRTMEVVSAFLGRGILDCH